MRLERRLELKVVMDGKGGEQKGWEAVEGGRSWVQIVVEQDNVHWLATSYRVGGNSLQSLVGNIRDLKAMDQYGVLYMLETFAYTKSTFYIFIIIALRILAHSLGWQYPSQQKANECHIVAYVMPQKSYSESRLLLLQAPYQPR